MISAQSKEIDLINDTIFQDITEKVNSQYQETYRAFMNVLPPDLYLSTRLFEKHGIKYRPQGVFRKFSHQITRSYLRQEMIMIQVNIAYFSLQVAVFNDICSNPFARISSKKDNGCSSLHFYQSDNVSMAVKSLYYQPEEFAFKFQRVLLEWTLLKICSALQCAPHLERFFGFDILVFKDCIQIAMEKCVSVERMPLSWFEILKEQLAVMHSFHIVHLDIKPDNIAFSPTLNKPIFIDFGFSSVIQEEVGFKKQSYFKGSAGFCSQQMLYLLVTDSPAYIDLYYNDLHCLQISFKGCSKKQTIYDEYLGEEQYLEKAILQIATKNPAKMIFICKFKYYYIKQNLVQLRLLLDNKKLLYTQNQILLRFMFDVFQHFYHQQVMEQFEQYSYTLQYQILVKRLSLQKSKIRLYVTQQHTEEDSKQLNSFSCRYIYFLTDVPDLKTEEIADFTPYYQFLLLQDYSVLPKEKCLELLFVCLRFNIRNISLEMKKQVAAKWSHILVPSIQNEKSQENLSGFKFIFQYLLSYCNTQPMTQWQYINYIEILFHSLLFGINVLDSFLTFVNGFKLAKSNLIEKLELKTYFLQLRDRLQVFNLADEANAQILTFHCSVNKEIDRLDQQIAIFKVQDYNQDVILAFSIYNDLYIKKDNSQKEQHFQQLQEKVRLVKNKRIQFYFQSVIFENKLQFLAKIQSTSESFSLMQIRRMTKDTVLQNINIHMLFQMSQMFILSLQLNQQFKRMVDQIKKIIYCPQLIQKLNIDKYTFLVDKKNKDKTLVTKYLRQLDASYRQLIRFGLKIKRHLFYLLLKIDSLEGYEPSFKDLLKSLYCKFKETKDQIYKMSQNQGVNFQEIYLNLDIEREFVTIVPELLQDFQKQIANIREYIASIDQNTIVKQQENSTFIVQDMSKVYQFVKLNYQFCQSQYYYYSILNDKKHQLIYLLQLAKLSNMLDLGFLHDQNCYLIMLLANDLKREDIFSKCIHGQYQLAFKIQSPIHYLLTSKSQLLIYTLKYFHKIGSQDKIISLLSMITVWINQNPLQQYLQHYIQKIHQFYLTNPTFFNYQTLMKKNAFQYPSNPYTCILFVYCALAAQEQTLKIKLMLKICSIISKMTLFGRKQVMKRYNFVYVNLQCISRLKKQVYFLRYDKPLFKFKPYSCLIKNKLKNDPYNCTKKERLKCVLSEFR